MRQVVVVLLLLAGARELSACAPAPHAGDTVSIVEESAVIVWDAAARTQHFIRRATFRGGARDFGFLVPTPTVPTLAEVSDGIFDELETRTRRETVHVERRALDWTPLAGIFLVSKGATETNAGAAVEVLSTQKVAGYDAVVLDASDAGALQAWLSEHGYAASADLTAWLDAYVQQRWKITAFKIDPQGSFAARTSAVKMSFATERPFFPYREPASQGATDVRSLRVWFLGPERVNGTIGEGGHWAGVLVWSKTLDDVFRGNVARMAEVVLPGSTRLSAYVDTSSLRPRTDDLFFARDADQSVYVPPPYVHENVVTTWIPADVVLLIAAVPAFVLIRRKRRKRTNIDAPGPVH